MKKKGFTLIELVVVVAIILLLAATLAPKLRKEVAKAKDAKSVAALGSLRTAANIFYADREVAPSGLAGDSKLYLFDATATTSDYLERDLIAYLSENTTNAKDANAPIGAYRATSVSSLTYGGFVAYDYTSSDDIYVFIQGAGSAAVDAASSMSENYDTKGNGWSSY